jgi:general stress protein 26
MLQRQLSHLNGCKLDTAKFKPLRYSMFDFNFSYTANMFTFTSLSQTPVASIEKRRQVHVVVGNAFFCHCNGSSAFSNWEAVSTIKVVIWNEESLVGFEVCLLSS